MNYKSIIVSLFLALSLSGIAQDKGATNADVKFASLYLEANRQRILGNLKDAASLYFLALEIQPENAAAYYDLSKIFIDNNDIPHAEEVLKKAVEFDNTNEWYKRDLARVYSNREKHKESAALFLELSNQSPESSEFAIDYATECVLMGKHKKALKVFDEIEQKFGIMPELTYRKFEYFIAKNDLNRAANELENLIALFPDEPQYYAKLAELYKAQNKPDQALAVFERANKAIPNDPYIQLSLFDFYEQRGESDKAFGFMQNAFSNPNLDIDAKVGILLKLFPKAEKNKDYRAKGIDLCERVMVAHPTDAKAFAVSGDFLALDEQKEKALECYLKAIKINPSKYPVWSQVLLLESDLNKYDSLVIHSQEAIDLFPTQSASYLFNGLAHNQLKQYKKAAISLEMGAILTVGNRFLSSQILASLGDAYHELGKHNSSDSAYNAALTYNENNLYVLNNYAYFLSLRGEKLEKALEMSKKTLDIEPNSVSYLDTYGWILFQLGKYNEAKTYLKQAMEHGGEKSAEVLEHYGDVLFKLNEYSESLSYFQKAKALGGASEHIDEKIKQTEAAQ